ncbi:MAG: hypothetical protein LPK85_06840, partial [Gammaproteobacteria bacterium]|nr:hypothetical protein [Gammaproteobacteria bacterium]
MRSWMIAFSGGVILLYWFQTAPQYVLLPVFLLILSLLTCAVIVKGNAGRRWGVTLTCAGLLGSGWAWLGGQDREQDV